MREAFKSAVATVCVSLLWAGLAGCGGKVDDTPVPVVHADCQAMCERLVAPGCAGDDLAGCLSQCAALPKSYCASQYQAFLDCSTFKGKYACSGDKAALTGCDPETTAYLTCLGSDAGVGDAAK